MMKLDEAESIVEFKQYATIDGTNNPTKHIAYRKSLGRGVDPMFVTFGSDNYTRCGARGSCS